MRNLHTTLLAAIMLLLPFVANAQLSRSQEFKDKYKLKEAVVLSRHNIRAPLSGNGSALANLTSHQWTDWSSAPSELTLRGGALETVMGQYFRKWLVDAGLFPENYVPTADDVNFYANSMQRTLATGNYFSSGFMPVADIVVNHRFTPSKMDPIFNPQLTKVSPEFIKLAMEQINAMGGKKGIKGINENLAEEYKLIADVLDLSNSPSAKNGGSKAFDNYNTEISFELYKEPSMRGSLKDANSASDAFILQYYEEPDSIKAGFGKNLTRDEWQKIARIKDVYGDVLFTAPIVAVNVAHPLLQYMRDELASPDRKFTFLVGHDSNIASVNAALGVEPYTLTEAIECKTPIGSKLVIEKWIGADGKEYGALNLVYQSVDQLRNVELLDLNNPPMIVPLSLEGLQANEDGLYLMSDLMGRFDKAIKAYEDIP
ncbi:MAG: histidine-type phosphatase [Prevotella sp.]|nr:histidine-type phosphatase [Bacteroides sp.]MCM1366838.1 histidine-type phosphatase [Prevotella sp.]MCM1437188.1 histidine-type phosphatase [Prevotella sp.]